MNLIWLLLQASWPVVTIAVITGLLSGASSAQLIALINQALSQPTTSQLLSYFIGLMVIGSLSGVVAQILLVKLSQDTIYRLRMYLSQSIIKTPLVRLEELGQHRLFAAMSGDVQIISDTVYVIPFLCVEVAVVLGCLAYLSWLSSLVFVAACLFLALAIVVVQLFLNKTAHFFRLSREEDERLFRHFIAMVGGIKELKLHSDRQQAFLQEEIGSTADKCRQYNSNALVAAAVAQSLGQLLLFAALGLLLFGMPRLLNIAPNVQAAYILTVIYVTLPLQSILKRAQALVRADVALKKVQEVGLCLADRAEPAVLTPTGDLRWRQLSLRHIVHRYRSDQDDHSFTLGPIDLTIYPSEIIFIVGGNGSGKSTLAKLLTGLYIPEAGEIIMDDQPITELNREWYRQHFSAIFTDFHLFEKFLGIAQLDLDERVRAYLQQFQLSHKVTVKEGRLSTVDLSQGQRKRLALITAYLENRPIYLFDEWASDQDPMFREVFYRQLLPELKQQGKTVVVISHDDRYFHLADRLIKLDYGKVEFDRVGPSVNFARENQI